MPAALSYEAFGEGEPLVIIHGLFGSKRNWMTLARRLGELSHVIAVDLRNHGDSTHTPIMSFEHMAGDIAHLADTLGYERISLAGHSLGGKVAMVHALQHPQRTARLMVLDVAPVRYDSGFGPYIEAMQSVPIDRIRHRKEAERYLVDAVESPSVRMFLTHNLVRDGDRFRWRLNLDALAHNLDDLAGFPDLPEGLRYEGPATFLRGDRSDYLHTGHEPLIRALFPAAQMHTVAGAGHWIHSDQPARVIAEIGNWLAQPAA
jgi:esterase